MCQVAFWWFSCWGRFSRVLEHIKGSWNWEQLRWNFINLKKEVTHPYVPIVFRTDRHFFQWSRVNVPEIRTQEGWLWNTKAPPCQATLPKLSHVYTRTRECAHLTRWKNCGWIRLPFLLPRMKYLSFLLSSQRPNIFQVRWFNWI